MKKAIISLVAVSLAVAIMPTTVFAHGHRGHRAKNTSYSLCNVDLCDTVGTHKHDGRYFYGHYSDDGHDYHDFGYGRGNGHH